MLCPIRVSKVEILAKKGSPMNRKTKLMIAIAAATLAILSAMAIHTQNVHAQNTAAQKNDAQDKNNDKYSLISPGGVAFSDFRGYEDWAVVSSSRTDDRLKVIVANPTMIKAYKAGIPGNGQPFPDGSMIAKLQWTQKRAPRPPSSWMCPTFFARLSSSKKTARDFRKAAGGDTRCSIMTPHRTSSRPIPKASPTADTRATRS
jgi:hypothetical protein